MSKSVEGVYRDGRVELAEPPVDVPEETPVVVTFPEPGVVDLRKRGIDEGQAFELRSRLATFSAEWDDPAMDAYDDYDAARTKM